MSHPTRGAWIETSAVKQKEAPRRSHPTRGAWIETIIRLSKPSPTASHPTRGAWIETRPASGAYYRRCGRTPPGVRALKRKVLTQFKYESRCRTPPGVRGLKLRLNRHYRARKRGASRDKDILLFNLMELFIISINKHNFLFFSLLAIFYTTF